MVLANYFSMFTIVSTILSVIALTAAATWSLRHPGSFREPLAIALGIAIVTGPIMLLGVVFNVLLRGAPSGAALTDPPPIAFMDSWATETLHVVLPLYLLIDLLFATRRRGLPWWSLPVLVATRSRGSSTRWCAVNSRPTHPVRRSGGIPTGSSTRTPPGGWASAFTYIAVLTAALVVIGAIVIAVGRFRERRATARRRTTPEVGVLQA